jgi:hypothetical protein
VSCARQCRPGFEHFPAPPRFVVCVCALSAPSHRIILHNQAVVWPPLTILLMKNDLFGSRANRVRAFTRQFISFMSYSPGRRLCGEPLFSFYFIQEGWNGVRAVSMFNWMSQFGESHSCGGWWWCGVIALFGKQNVFFFIFQILFSLATYQGDVIGAAAVCALACSK